MSIDAFNELVSAIYEAAEDPSKWAACLDRIRVALDGSGMTLMYHDASSQARSVTAWAAYDNSVVELYRDHYSKCDPWGRELRPSTLSTGRVVDGRSLVRKADVLKTEYYADFGRRIGSAQSMFGSIESIGDRTALIIAARAANQPGFAEQDLELLRRLMPHMQQAFRLHRRITVADGRRSSAWATLDTLPLGVVLVDRQGRPVFVNAAARRMAECRDALTIERDGICGLSPVSTTRLRRGIARAVEAAQAPADGVQESAFTIEKTSGGLGLRVVIVPVGRGDEGMGCDVGAAAAVFLGDPDRRVIENPSRLVELFGLTPAEAGVAMHMVNGETLARIAITLGVKTSTTRWYAKQILQKAGVNTQAQFVSLVLRMPAHLVSPSDGS